MIKTIVMPKPPIDLKSFSEGLKNIERERSKLIKIYRQEEENFFEKVKTVTESIFFSNTKSNQEKLNAIVRLKGELEFKRVNAHENKIKLINKAINDIILSTIGNLTYQLEAEKKYGTVREKFPSDNSCKQVDNSNSEKPISKETIAVNNSEKELVPVTAKEAEVHLDKLQNNSNQNSSDSFIKIKMYLSKDEIFKFFERLSNFKNDSNNLPYLSPEDVEQLLSQAFLRYTEKSVKHKLLHLNLTKRQFGIFYSFIFYFYLKNERRRAGVKMKYARFLKQNFSCFSKLDIKTLYTSIRNHKSFKDQDILNFKI